MANTVLEKTINNVNPADLKPGYALSQGPDVPSGGFIARDEAMSVTGSARAALVLFAVLVASGTWAWVNVPQDQQVLYFFGGVFVGFALALITIFKPKTARITAPMYSVAEGIAVGVISRIFEDAYSGIVVQAVLATGAIVFVMYTLYSTGILKVTPKFRKIVIGATTAIMLFYAMNLFLSFAGVNMPLIGDTGIMGIAFSAIVICIAASNLALDFDFIEKGSQAGLPKYMNWAAAFGLVVTVVWIYIEVLRLLAKMRN